MVNLFSTAWSRLSPLHELRHPFHRDLNLLQRCREAAAQEAFAAAVYATDELLSFTAQNYAALQTKGLALCGLTLCDSGNRTSAASEAYRAARAINRDAGIVARVLRLFDALAVVDSTGVLKEVRAAAAGE